MEESPTRVPRWDDEPEDPKLYWDRKLREARARDELKRREREEQRLIDNREMSLGRPFLVPKRN